MQFRRYLLGNKLPHESDRPLSIGLIYDSEKRRDLSQKKSFSVCSEPGKTPEAANDIPETSTNETTMLGAASTSLNEMPSTEKDLNGTMKQLRLLEKNAQISKRQLQIWKTKIKHFSQTSSHLFGLPLMR